MQRDQAERIAAAFLKPVYGFALKRCADLQSAEDLAQEIVLRVFRALLAKDDVGSPDQFIWTVAHNTLANYYRKKANTVIGVPIDALAETLSSAEDASAGLIDQEATERLHREIAYLSKRQRRIVIAYYYENKRQEAIADELDIPLGTVKWHLFEAKKELKRGMDTVRNVNELKFNPIQFAMCGTNGSPGTKGSNNNYFRSALSQNIVYSVRKESKTVNEMADCLGVSPVYVESEAEYLAEYGFLIENKGKYRCNILLDEPTNALVDLHDGMYRDTAKVFANELFDELTGSGILKDERIICGQTDEPISLTESPRAEDNFLLWSLIPYIAALSGEHLMDKSISFDEAMTIRPDGGRNICCASVISPHVKKPMYFDGMLRLCGPCWNANKEYVLWTIDSEWSAGRLTENYIDQADRILSLFSRAKDGQLSKAEYAFLAENGILKTNGDDDGRFKSAWQIVWLQNTAIKRKLLSIGDRIKEKHWAEMQAMREPYIKAVLDATPKHLLTMQKFGLQCVFFSDGWFVLHCLKELVNAGRLKLPTEEQKKSLATLIVPNE